jgi:hypothetical protein
MSWWDQYAPPEPTPQQTPQPAPAPEEPPAIGLEGGDGRHWGNYSPGMDGTYPPAGYTNEQNYTGPTSAELGTDPKTVTTGYTGPAVDGVGQASATGAGAVGPWQAGQYQNQVEGYDWTKLNDATHISPKYVFGRIAGKYNVQDPAQRQAMLKELQADPSGYFKNATLGGTKGDILTIGGQLDPKFDGISQFDIIRGAGEGGLAFQWGGITPAGTSTPTTPKPSQTPTPLNSTGTAGGAGQSQWQSFLSQYQNGTKPTQSAQATTSDPSGYGAGYGAQQPQAQAADPNAGKLPGTLADMANPLSMSTGKLINRRQSWQ